MLKWGCPQLASTRLMALLNEMCVRRFFDIAQLPDIWTTLVAYLRLPELDEQEYFQKCIEDNCLLTLHLISLYKLQEAGGDQDEVVSVGAEISKWIMALKIRDPEVSLKFLLLVGTYLKIFVGECERVDMRGRLRATIVPFAKMMLKLGEDRESEGLFGAVGFGSRSPFAVQFRFYCRAIGTFLATVTREVPGFEKMPEALNAQLRNKEYQAVWDTVQFAVSTINNPSSTMTTLPTFHQGLVYRLFPTTSYLHSAL